MCQIMPGRVQRFLPPTASLLPNFNTTFGETMKKNLNFIKAHGLPVHTQVEYLFLKV